MISQSLLIAKLDCKVRCETAICNFHLISLILILKLMLTLPCTILMHMHAYNCWVHGHSLMVISKELDQTSSIMGEPIIIIYLLCLVWLECFIACRMFDVSINNLNSNRPKFRRGYNNGNWRSEVQNLTIINKEEVILFNCLIVRNFSKNCL